MSDMIACPRCGSSVPSLLNIDGNLMQRLSEGGQSDLPSQVCESCFRDLAGGIARGSVLMAQEKAKEHKKLMLWKSRVALVRKARNLMHEKAYSEAAVGYEKYLRVLEIVFEVEPGGLTPEQFKDSARTQELTVVASVYWDLIRIYDTSSRYGDRMALATKKLAQFLRFTPLYPDIVRKAKIFEKSAKNPDIIKAFLHSAVKAKSKCFIATSAFNSPIAEEVWFLQNWRDQVLSKKRAGPFFIHLYYLVSPTIARFLDTFPSLKPFVRGALRLIIDRALRHRSLLLQKKASPAEISVDEQYTQL